MTCFLCCSCALRWLLAVKSHATTDVASPDAAPPGSASISTLVLGYQPSDFSFLSFQTGFIFFV